MKILSHHVHPATIGLAVVEFCLSWAAVYAAAWVRAGGSWDFGREFMGPVFPRGVVFAAAIVFGLMAMGLYHTRQRLTVEAVLVRVGIALVLAAIGLTLIYFAIPSLAMGRGWWALSLAFTALLLITGRIFFVRLIDETAFQRRVLIYGAGDRVTSLLRLRRRSDQRGFRIVAFVPAPGDKQQIDDPRVQKINGSLFDFAREQAIDQIVVAMDDRRQGLPIKDLLDCQFAGISVVEIVTFLERESGRVTLDVVNPTWMIFSEGFTRRSMRRTTTRVFDLTVSVALLAITWPFILVAARAIVLEDGRPGFYRQTRVGRFGVHFRITKLRSMHTDAESENGAQWAKPGDTRITRVGRIIRKLRIDELPQLFNVIAGDMSFVGPRPERPEFVEGLVARIPYYRERHCVKPGLTGWAQLSYSYGSSEQDALQKLQYDLYYVKNQSLIFDLMILVQTVEVILLQKGSR